MPSSEIRDYKNIPSTHEIQYLPFKIHQKATMCM